MSKKTTTHQPVKTSPVGNGQYDMDEVDADLKESHFINTETGLRGQAEVLSDGPQNPEPRKGARAIREWLTSRRVSVKVADSHYSFAHPPFIAAAVPIT